MFDAMIERGKELNSLAAGALEALPENTRTGRMEDGTGGKVHSRDCLSAF